jgi:hypothetical protein
MRTARSSAAQPMTILFHPFDDHPSPKQALLALFLGRFGYAAGVYKRLPLFITEFWLIWNLKLESILTFKV